MPFGYRGALLRDNNSMVKALCPVGMRVAEEEPPRPVGCVGRRAAGTGHCSRGLSHLPQCPLSARALVNLEDS